MTLRYRFRLGLVLGALWIGALASSEALACGPCTCPAAEGDPSIVPYPSSDPMPRNLRFFLWLADRDPSSLSLEYSDGQSIPFSVAPAGIPDAYWLQPQGLLAAGSSIRLGMKVLAPQEPEQGPLLYEYPIGHDINLTPPSVESVAVESKQSSELCDTYVGAELVVIDVLDDFSRGGDFLLAQLDLDDGQNRQRLFIPFMPWRGTQTAPFGRVTVENHGGDSDCFGYRTATNFQVGQHLLGNLTLWDWSGNHREWPGLEIEPTETRPGGCGDAQYNDDTVESDTIDTAGGSQDSAPIEGRGMGCALSRSGAAATHGLFELLLSGLLAGLRLRKRSIPFSASGTREKG